jgi:plastocyanin
MRRPASLLLLCLPLLALPACGAEEPPPARARGSALTIRATDFRYTPQVIRARSGTLEVTLVNRGRLAHTWRLERGEAIVAKVSSLLPGDRQTKRMRLRQGEYRFFCALSNHEELGMYGTLSVK